MATDWTTVSKQGAEFTVRATAQGVQFVGRSDFFTSADQLRELAKVLDLALTEHNRLAPKIASTIAGH